MKTINLKRQTVQPFAQYYSETFENYLKNRDFYSSEKLNANYLKKAGERKTLALFQESANRIPAYKDFLIKHKIKASSIKTISDFQQVEPVTKENYIYEYPLKDRCRDGHLGYLHTICSTSGTTGNPNFWALNMQQEIGGSYSFEYLLSQFGIKENQETLFVVGFPLDNGISGTFCFSSANMLSFKGYKLTTMSPGYDTKGIVSVMKSIAHQFDQTLIVGFSPFLKEIVDILSQEDMDLAKLNIKLTGAGQMITESWRKYVTKKLGGSSPYHTILNVYGSADAGLMAFESSVSVFMRELMSKNRLLGKEIFKTERLPSIYHFDPRLIRFEGVNDELVLTLNSGAPLIRYNIKDEGGVFDYHELANKVSLGNHVDELKQKGISTNHELPLVYLFGRSKFMIKFYGANIYSEHIQSAFTQYELQAYVTGNYHKEIIYDEQNNPVILCKVEINPNVRQSLELCLLLQRTFVDVVSQINSEYNYLLNKMGRAKVQPQIKLYPYAHEEYFPKGGNMKKLA